MMPLGRAGLPNSGDNNVLAALIENLRTQVAVTPKPTLQKWMHVCVGSSTKARRVAWYDPCDNAALDSVLRASCGVPPDRIYLLLDATMSAVAVSSSLPSGATFELVGIRNMPAHPMQTHRPRAQFRASRAHGRSCCHRRLASRRRPEPWSSSTPSLRAWC